MPTPNRWTPEENDFLMRTAYRDPWDLIAAKLGRTEAACKAQFNKIRRLRMIRTTWRGITL